MPRKRHLTTEQILQQSVPRNSIGDAVSSAGQAGMLGFFMSHSQDEQLVTTAANKSNNESSVQSSVQWGGYRPSHKTQYNVEALHDCSIFSTLQTGAEAIRKQRRSEYLKRRRYGDTSIMCELCDVLQEELSNADQITKGMLDALATPGPPLITRHAAEGFVDKCLHDAQGIHTY